MFYLFKDFYNLGWWLFLSVQCDRSTSFLSIYNGFASTTKPPEKKLCGQLYFFDRDIFEFKSTTFRIVLRWDFGKIRPLRPLKKHLFLNVNTCRTYSTCSMAWFWPETNLYIFYTFLLQIQIRTTKRIPRQRIQNCVDGG